MRYLCVVIFPLLFITNVFSQSKDTVVIVVDTCANYIE